MSKKEKKLIFISIVLSVFLIAIAYFYQIGFENSSEFNEEEDNNSKEFIEKDLEVGEPGSTHAHMSFVMLIDDQLYNFSRDKYYEKSEYVHFHEGNGVVIHKHATGVSIPYFLETLGIQFDDNCIILDEGEEYCNDEDKEWVMIVNGLVIDDPLRYELRHGDRILLDYSDDNKLDVRVKAQSTVPDVPPSLMKDRFNINN